eukprot:3465116-Pleurochrysis_carterae.AAC.2
MLSLTPHLFVWTIFPFGPSFLEYRHQCSPPLGSVSGLRCSAGCAATARARGRDRRRACKVDERRAPSH